MSVSSNVRLHVKFDRRAIDYLKRCKKLRKSGDAPSLFYAALELRCGIEARMKEYAHHAPGLSKSQKKEWEIKKLGRTLEEAYGLGNKIVVLLIRVSEAPPTQFLFAPVCDRLQDIGKRLGDYLHPQPEERVDSDDYWEELSSMLNEGCGLLQLACAGEVLRPSLSDGLHFSLASDDSRVPLVRQLQAGAVAEIQVLEIDPQSPITYVPADAA